VWVSVSECECEFECECECEFECECECESAESAERREGVEIRGWREEGEQKEGKSTYQ
jgi:hypothetical protein